MSSSKAIKVKYSNTYNFPVSLSEYLICEDDGIKNVIFKFYNSVNKTLSEFTFTISEYDINNKLIKSSRMTVTGVFKNNSLFIPKNKFVLNSDTKYIKYTLNVAKFDRLIYNEGKYIRSNIILDVKDDPIPVKKAKIDKLNRKDNKQFKEHGFVVRNLNETYKSRGASGFITFLSIIMVIFSFVLMFTFKQNTNKVSYDGLDYRLTLTLNETDKTCFIDAYEGSARSLIISEKYYDYTVIGVSDECFMNEEIEDLFIEGNSDFHIGYKAFAYNPLMNITSKAKLSISSYAFAECNNLSLVDCANAIAVDQFAFSNCYSLDRINLSNAICSVSAFDNCSHVSTVFIGETNATYFNQLFGEYSNNYFRNIGYFGYEIRQGFFDKNLYLDNFSYRQDAFIGDEALPTAYRYGATFDEC